jgi:hypothetical protein
MGDKEDGLAELRAKLTDPELSTDTFEELTRRVKILEQMAKL